MRRIATPSPGPLSAAACALAVLLVTAGCTICPDPFDYAGPVPDGSAPQNDFRARANGIAPIGGVPRPWPPVVQAAPAAADSSTAVATASNTASPSADESSEDEPAPMQPVAAAASIDTQVDAPAVRPVTEEPTLEEILPPPPQVFPETGPLRETPGWRPRR